MDTFILAPPLNPKNNNMRVKEGKVYMYQNKQLNDEWSLMAGEESGNPNAY